MKTIFLLLVVLLAACSQLAPQPLAPPTPDDPTPTKAPLPVVTSVPVPTDTPAPTATPLPSPTPTPTLDPMTIAAMRMRDYPGSDIVLEQELENGPNYYRRLVSYRSEGLKIYALMTIPMGEKPATGWPVIIFNHGYIPPKQYSPTERYVAYVNAIASHGYIVFREDYRGNGNSEGEARGAYSRPDYTIDVLNAVASMKRYPDADPQRIGMWGHSMGGYLTLRAMVISKDIKVGVIWAGVVGSYADMLYRWHATPPATLSSGATSWRGSYVEKYGTPDDNPDFWNSISSDSYLADLSGPLQLHHTVDDSEVPFEFSQSLYDKATAAGDTVEFYSYPGDDHNIAKAFSVAMQRSLEFFDRYLK
jgi:dipeptidyl aminopeptidase/acylaminoacyl peptidase